MKVGRPIKENIYLNDDFTAYLQSKNLAPSTITCYLQDLGLFLIWINKKETQITKPDVLKYLEYLKNKRNLENISRSRTLNSLNHYFTFLLSQEQINTNPCAFLKIRGTQKKTLYRTYTPEELTQLYDNFCQLFVHSYDDSRVPKNQRKPLSLIRARNAAILNILVHQGVKTSEIYKILLQDIDLMKATLKIRGGKKGKERILSIEATQIGVLMDYLQNIRPQFLEYHVTDSEKLFLTLPKNYRKETPGTSLKNNFQAIVRQLKSIDARFVKFEQIRVSIITYWVKTHGLRKAQIMAGHRHIIATERYRLNDLDGLTNDIDKLHPF